MKNKTKKQDLKVAYWNVRTILDRANSIRPECRSDLIAYKLSCLDIAALSEVRIADEGIFQDVGSAFTLFGQGNHQLMDVLQVEDSW